MLAASEMGAVIAPPVPALYAKPASMKEMARQSVAPALELVGLFSPATRRWA